MMFLKEAFIFCGISICFLLILLVMYFFKTAIDVVKVKAIRDVMIGKFDKEKK